MRVRVKPDSKVLAVTAFGGCQYIRAEWRDVPKGCEEEAKSHPYLEVEPGKKSESKAVPIDITATEEKPSKPIPKGKKAA